MDEDEQPFFVAPIMDVFRYMNGFCVPHRPPTDLNRRLFPKPSDININMRPFIVGKTFEECMLPNYVKQYWPLLELCLSPDIERESNRLWSGQKGEAVPTDVGKTYFLTIE